MSKCRVLQIVASSHGGGAEVVRGLVKELDAGVYQSTLAIPDDGGQLGRSDFEQAGAECLIYDIAAGFSVRELWRLRRLIRGRPWDIVHCHGARAALWGRLAALGPGRPRIVFGVHGLSSVHYGGVKRALLVGVERVLRGVTDATLCDSEAERADVIRHRIAAPEHAFTVRSGIDIERLDGHRRQRAQARAELGLEQTWPVVVTVCRLHKPRDFDTLLRAMRTVANAHPTATLLIVGGGPLSDSVDEQIEMLNLGENARRLGFVGDVGQVLAAADLFVLATQGWEGLPLAPLEAMAARLPVVISDVGGNREAVLDGETGLVVPPRQPGALAEALMRLLTDSELSGLMGDKGRQRALAEFSAKRMASETAGVYSRLSGGC